jgi:hypothetical protein
MIRVQGYVKDYDAVCRNGDLSMWECHYGTWRVLPSTWISNFLGGFIDPVQLQVESYISNKQY